MVKNYTWWYSEASQSELKVESLSFERDMTEKALYEFAEDYRGFWLVSWWYYDTHVSARTWTSLMRNTSFFNKQSVLEICLWPVLLNGPTFLLLFKLLNKGKHFIIVCACRLYFELLSKGGVYKTGLFFLYTVL